MDTWEKEYIAKNICFLISNTFCNTNFRKHLVQNGLITEEEEDELSKLHQEKCRVDAAKRVYEILQTRTNGYQGLAKALEATRQSGALKILTLGADDPQVKKMEIKSKTEKLLRLKVNFKGKTMSVKETFPSLVIDDAAIILNDKEVWKELDELKANTILKLDTNLPDPGTLYIPRFMSNWVELDPEVFKIENIPDIFVFKGITKEHLRDLVRPLFIQKSSDQLLHISSRHIVLGKEEDWDDLVNIAEFPLHLISKETKGSRDAYILIKSTEVSAVLLGARKVDSAKHSEVYLNEERFIEKLKTRSENQGAVICDVPGMGKTWLLQSLAKRLKDNCENDIVLFITLSTLAEKLPHQEEKSKLELTFLSLALGSKLAAWLVNHYLSEEKSKLFMLLDGYDEININRLEKTTAFLTSALKCGQSGVKLIMASRPHFRAHLEKTFNLVAYDILPFERAQQVQKLVQHWQQVHPGHNSEKLTEYAEYCIKGTEKIKGNDDPDILGVPLKCYLLAVVSEKQAANFSKPNRKTPIKLPHELFAKSVFSLYYKFVEAALEKMSNQREWSAADRSKWKANMLNFHTMKALDLLEYSTTVSPAVDVGEDEVNRVGIMSVSGSAYHFIHRSFAEFLAGQFLADLWLNAYQASKSNLLEATSFPIQDVLSTKLSIKTGNEYIFRTNSFLSHSMDYIFINNNVLWFMDCSFSTSLRFSRPENLPTTKREKSQKPHSGVCNNTSEVALLSIAEQIFLEENLYSILISCVTGRHMQILRKVFELIHCNTFKVHLSTIFTSKSASEMFLDNDQKTLAATEESSLCVLFLLLAESDSQELCHQFFNFFGAREHNSLRELLRRHNPDFIRRMVTVLLKQMVPSQGLISLLSGMQEFNCVDEEDLMSSKLHGGEDFILDVTRLALNRSRCKVSSQTLSNVFHRFDQMQTIFSIFKIDMGLIEYKAEILHHAIMCCTDDEVFILILMLFGTQNRTCKDIKLLIKPFHIQRIEGGLTGDVVSGICWKSERVLEMIEVGNVSKAFALIRRRIPGMVLFQHLDGVEILKILLPSSKGLRNLTLEGENYLHVAVYKQNNDWVRYLLENGHSANQKDKYGRTPLHYVEGDCPLEITKLLLLHGANPYAVDWLGNTVAHGLSNSYESNSRRSFMEWTEYMLECGHYKLWMLENYEGETPVDILQSKDGEIGIVLSSLIKTYEEKAATSSSQKID